MKKNKLLILSGPPGIGKTTYAKYLLSIDSTYARFNRDDVRKMVADSYVVEDKLETLINHISDFTIKELLTKYNVIVDNTNCKVRYIKELADTFGQIAEVELLLMEPDMDLETIKTRNKSREKSVPDEVVDSMFQGYKNVVKRYQEIYEYIQEVSKPKVSIENKQDNTLPKAIIVDIDGTVAHMGKRSPFDWAKVNEDTPDENVINIVKALHKYHLIFLSGRDSVCRDKTVEWINKHIAGTGLTKRNYDLFMRPQNDYRKDSIIKEELYNNHIKNKYYIEAVFDDRDQVVNFWRMKIGLKCFQVDYGNF